MLPYLLICAVFIGCERDDSSSAPRHLPLRDATVVLIAPSAGDPYAPAIIGGALHLGRDYPGVQALVVTPSSATGVDLQAAVAQSLTHQPVAIAMCVDDPQLAAAALGDIRSAGVPLITIGVRTDAIVAAHVEVDWSGGATLLGENLVQIAEGRQSYVLIHADGHSDRHSTLYASFSAAARRQYTLTLLEERNAPAEAARPAIDDVLLRFRHTALVIALDPSPWLSQTAPPSLPENCRFATLSTAPSLWPRLRSGEAAALVGPIAGDVGRAAMDLLIKAVLNELRGHTVRYIPCELVTAATLSDFAARYAAAGDLDALGRARGAEGRPAGP